MREMAMAAGVLSLLLATACGGNAAGSGTARAVPVATSVAAGAQTATRATSDHKSEPPKPKPRTWWHPMATGPNDGPEFQWELDHPLNIHSAQDMGVGAMNVLGRQSGGPTVYDIDGIENPASTVTTLHKLKDKVICYIEVGAAGNYYSAAEEHLRVTYYQQLREAHDLGKAVSGYPEYYLNINAASTLRIIKAMIQQQCAAKGFDAVEPDIDDSYTDTTGFNISENDNIRYDKELGTYAHSLGLAWGQKNGDNDPEFSQALEPTTDFLLDEECNYYRTCGIVTPPYVRAGKLVLNAEYTDDWGPHVAADLREFCAADAGGHIDGTLFTQALAGQRNPCR
jgi:hypothetical protein